MAKWNRAIVAQGALALFAFTLLLGAAARKMQPSTSSLEDGTFESESEISLNSSSAGAAFVDPGTVQVPTRESRQGLSQGLGQALNPALRQGVSRPDGGISERDVFHGMILKGNGDFVFRDQSGVLYRLDTPARAKAFEGKSVGITGKMELAEHLIHVVAIAPANGY